jgi:hypothetical protein
MENQWLADFMQNRCRPWATGGAAGKVLIAALGGAMPVLSGM